MLYVGFRELTLTFLLHLFDLETTFSFDWHKIQGGENPDLTKGIVHPKSDLFKHVGKTLY